MQLDVKDFHVQLKYWRCGAGTFRMLFISLPNVLKHAYANHKNNQ